MRKWIFAVLLSLLTTAAYAQMTGAGPGMNTAQVYNGQFFGANFKADPIISGPITLATCTAASSGSCIGANYRSYFQLASGATGWTLNTRNLINGSTTLQSTDQNWVFTVDNPSNDLDAGLTFGSNGAFPVFDLTLGTDLPAYTSRIYGYPQGVSLTTTQPGSTIYSTVATNSSSAMTQATNNTTAATVYTQARAGGSYGGEVSLNASTLTGYARSILTGHGLIDWAGAANIPVVWGALSTIRNAGSTFDTYTVTIVDPDVSITTGSVTFCGYTTASTTGSMEYDCDTVAITGVGTFNGTKTMRNISSGWLNSVSAITGDEEFSIGPTSGAPTYSFQIDEWTNFVPSFSLKLGNSLASYVSGPSTALCPIAAGCTIHLKTPDEAVGQSVGTVNGTYQTVIYNSESSAGPIRFDLDGEPWYVETQWPVYFSQAGQIAIGDTDTLVVDWPGGPTTETYTFVAGPVANPGDILVGADDYETFRHAACALNNDTVRCAAGVDYIALGGAASTLVRAKPYETSIDGLSGYIGFYTVGNGSTYTGTTVFIYNDGAVGDYFGTDLVSGGDDPAIAITVASDIAPGTNVQLMFEPTQGEWIPIGASTSGSLMASSSIVFEGAVNDAYETTLTVTEPTTSDKTITLPNATGTVALIGSSNNNLTTTPFNFYGSGTSPGYTNYDLNDTDGSGGDTYPFATLTSFQAGGLTVQVNKTGDAVLRHPVLTARPGLIDEDTLTANGGVYLAYATGMSSRRTYDFLIRGGYTLDGTTTSAVADEVDITTADPGGGTVVTAATIQVCGYRTDYDKAVLRVFCENVVSAAPPQTLTTTQTFVEITVVKTNSYTFSGAPNAITDETIAVAWDADATSVLAAILQVEHGASDYIVGTASPVLTTMNVWIPDCLDLEGCTVELGQTTAVNNLSGNTLREAVQMTIIGAAGTEDITFTDDAEQQLAGAASFVMQDNDTLQLIWVYKNTAWVELGRSDN